MEMTSDTEPNAPVEWSTLLGIRGVPASILGPKTTCTVSGFSLFSSSFLPPPPHTGTSFQNMSRQINLTSFLAQQIT